jgi:hypothetical protein
VYADKTGTPKFRGSGCQFPQSQCHPSPRTGIALGTRLVKPLTKMGVVWAWSGLNSKGAGWAGSPFVAGGVCKSVNFYEINTVNL